MIRSFPSKKSSPNRSKKTASILFLISDSELEPVTIYCKTHGCFGIVSGCDELAIIRCNNQNIKPKTITTEVKLIYENRLEPVCGTYLTTQSATMICIELGFENLVKFEIMNTHDGSNMVVPVCRHGANQLSDCTIINIPNCKEGAILEQS